jgi:hypothetical protein
MTAHSILLAGTKEVETKAELVNGHSFLNYHSLAL